MICIYIIFVFLLSKYGFLNGHQCRLQYRRGTFTALHSFFHKIQIPTQRFVLIFKRKANYAIVEYS